MGEKGCLGLGGTMLHNPPGPPGRECFLWKVGHQGLVIDLGS